MHCRQEAGREANIHATHEIFDEKKAKAILLVDDENAFHTIKRNVLLHNIEYLCAELTMFIYHCYVIPVRPFIIRDKGIRSREGTTQGDPFTIATFAKG